MPREFLHWSVLESVKDSHTEEDRALYSRLWPYAYWGALLQDAGYFLSGKLAKDGEAVSDLLHGTEGEDTFTTLRSLAQGIPVLDTEWREPAAMFLWGALSHAHVDIVFHPWIVYTTGNYYHPDRKAQERARLAHRLLETHLDWWVMENSHRPRVVLLSEVYKGAKKGWQPLINWLSNGTSKTTDWWQQAFAGHAKFQSRFHSDVWGILVRSLSKVAPGILGSRDALFAYDRRDALSYFGGELVYRHPVSGDSCSTNFRNLYQISARRTQQSWNDVAMAMRAGHWDELLKGQVGASLDLGLPKVKSSEAKFFTDIPVDQILSGSA